MGFGHERRERKRKRKRKGVKRQIINGRENMMQTRTRV
jgi:hypothetical protein